MKDVETSHPFYCRRNGSGEVFDLSMHSDSLRSQNITYQDSQKANQLSIFSSQKLFQICDLSGATVVCVVCNSSSPAAGDIGGPGVPALNPKTHTSCLSHCFPPLLQLSPLHSLFSALLFSQPFCSASFLFQTNSSNFLFYCRFWKETFSCSWCTQWCACASTRVCVWERERSCTCFHSSKIKRESDNKLTLLQISFIVFFVGL